MSRKLGSLVSHPSLLAAYAVLAMLATNAGQMRPAVGLRPLLGLLAGSAVLCLILRLVLGDAHRAGMATSLLVVILLSYGHVYDALKDALPGSSPR
ncbi:MAG: hypothetical protein MUO23_06300 [Anaerolineales bacterium]|nr:hypothetical protein [Anaerolineales bacterium]